jgi:hypothetical protein
MLASGLETYTDARLHTRPFLGKEENDLQNRKE